jgi:hypothetical protein
MSPPYKGIERQFSLLYTNPPRLASQSSDEISHSTAVTAAPPQAHSGPNSKELVFT